MSTSTVNFRATSAATWLLCALGLALAGCDSDQPGQETSEEKPAMTQGALDAPPPVSK